MAKVPRGEINQHGVDLGMIANNTRGLTDADVDNLIEIREDNREQIANAIKSAIAKGLETIGLVAEGYAKARTPVFAIKNAQSYGNWALNTLKASD